MSQAPTNMGSMADEAIYRLAARQEGLFTTDQALACGLTARTIKRRLHRRQFTRLHGRVLGLPGWPVGDRRELWLATLAVPQAAVARWSAAGILRLPVPGVPRRPEVVVPKGTTYRIRGVVVHETRVLRAIDRTEVSGLAVTTPARTMIDLAAEMRADRYFHTVDQTLQSGRLALEDLAAAFDSITKVGRAGAGLVGAYLVGRAAPPSVEVSELEFRFDRLLQGAGLPTPVKQFRPPWYDGLRGVVDRAWPDERILVELDGRSYHATMQAMTDDRRRDRTAQLNGWRALRYTFAEITRRSAEVVDELRGLLAAGHPDAA